MNQNLLEKLKLIQTILEVVSNGLKEILKHFDVVTIDLSNKDLKDEV